VPTLRSGNRVLVVVDTTEFFQDVRLTRNPFFQLFRRASSGSVAVIIPEVVVLETVRHAAVQADKTAQKIREVERTLNQMGHLRSAREIDLAHIHIEAGEVRRSYEPWLRAELVNRGATIYPLPSAQHSQILAWTLADRKPFKQSGEGYRDALIWATLVEIARKSPATRKIYLVSGNSTDFGGPDAKLADELSADVAAVNDTVQVTLVGSLDDLFAQLGKEDESPSEPDDEVELEGSSGDFDLPDFLATAVLAAAGRLPGAGVYDFADPEENGRRPLALPDRMSDANLDEVAVDEETLEWNSGVSFEDGTELGYATIRARITIEGSILKSVMPTLSEPMEIILEDWSPFYSRVIIPRSVDLFFEARINPQLESVDSLDLVWIAGVSIEDEQAGRPQSNPS
jgi:hypothetical protein